jgi:hypothetical protein
LPFGYQVTWQETPSFAWRTGAPLGSALFFIVRCDFVFSLELHPTLASAARGLTARPLEALVGF